MPRHRSLLGLALVLLVAAGLTACGDDDGGGAVAGSTTSTMDHTTETTGMGMQTNPCAPGGSGELPGMTMMTPAADATPVTITATEYEFAGVDALRAGGAFAITFENEGKQLHELHIAKLADGDDRSVEELLQDPSAEATTEAVGHSFACPGTTAPVAGANLTEPGRYLVLCFIPTGATADTDPKDFDSLGAPHAMQGMVVEVDIA